MNLFNECGISKSKFKKIQVHSVRTLAFRRFLQNKFLIFNNFYPF